MVDAKRNQTPGKIPINQVENQLVEGLRQGDVNRQIGIEDMARIKRIKLANVRRERGRLEAKPNHDKALLERLDRQMVYEHGQMVDARLERDRICVPQPERKKDRWLLHGYLKDADGHPLEKLNVSLYRDENFSGQPIATVASNNKGYYQFDLPWKATRKPQEEKEPQLKPREPVYIGVQGSDGDLVHKECLPVRASAGGLSYRDIKVDVVTRTGTENYPTRLLGNSGSRELHDLNNEKKNCFIDQIKPDRRVYFRSIAQAQSAGYDFCAKCFGREASER